MATTGVNGIAVLANISYALNGLSGSIGSTSTINTGTGFTYLDLNSAGTKLYGGANNSYYTINTSDNTFTSTSLTGNHIGIAVNSAGTTLYVPSYNTTNPGKVDIVTLP